MIDDLISHLKDSDAVRGSVSGQIYNTTAPDNGAKLPYITAQEIDTSPEYALHGEIGKARTTLQVDCWARDPGGGKRAREIGQVIRNRLSGYRGMVGDTFCDKVTLERQGLDEEQPEDGSGNYVKRWSMDFEIVHTVSVPDFT